MNLNELHLVKACNCLTMLLISLHLEMSHYEPQLFPDQCQLTPTLWRSLSAPHGLHAAAHKLNTNLISSALCKAQSYRPARTAKRWWNVLISFDE
jgi:hypothetical protein